MEALAALTVVAAALVVVFTAVVAKPGMDANTKRIIAGCFAGFLGLLSAIISGQIVEVPPTVVASITRAVVVVAIVIVASQGFYKAFKGSLEKLEAVTSGKPITVK